MNFSPADMIGGCRIVRKLGSGGMGAVFEVEHVQLGVHYAIKVFTRDHGDVETLRNRFRAEGRALARLRHPNLLRVYDFGKDAERGLLYYVMDLVAGADGKSRTLADIEPGEADERQLAVWYAQLKSALEYIHSQGIVHRDFKPGNILIDAQGNAILGDFGISRFTDDTLRTALGAENTVEIDRTDSRTVMGSVMYLAPETRRGEKATPAADAYALGVTFYRLLTGMWYEPGPVADGLLDAFGNGWQTALRRLLSEDPAARLPIPPIEMATPSRSMKSLRFIVILAVVAMLAITGVFLCLVGRDHRARRAVGRDHRVRRMVGSAPRADRNVQYTFDQFFPPHAEHQPK